MMLIAIPQEQCAHVAAALRDYASALAVLPAASDAHGTELRRVMAWLHATANKIDEEIRGYPVLGVDTGSPLTYIDYGT